jgi:hypothetical protein
LAGLIGAMDKYSGPGNGGAADRAFWLQAYNGGSHVVDRVARGTVAINNLLATVCGAIQPDSAWRSSATSRTTASCSA